MTNEFMIPSDACIGIFLERNQDMPKQLGWSKRQEYWREGWTVTNWIKEIKIMLGERNIFVTINWNHKYKVYGLSEIFNNNVWAPEPWQSTH